VFAIPVLPVPLLQHLLQLVEQWRVQQEVVQLRDLRRAVHQQLVEPLLRSQLSAELAQVVPHAPVADSLTLHLPIALQKLE
jgi:hypothetical protein